MGVRFETARFHVSFGPDSLFRRVEYIMARAEGLSLAGNHFQRRWRERNIPTEVVRRIESFRQEDWQLVSCEVRVDKGKFVNSTWETVWNNQAYWITIGFGNLVQTVVAKDGSGLTDIVKDGRLYDYVEQVNRELMAQDTEKRETLRP